VVDGVFSKECCARGEGLLNYKEPSEGPSLPFSSEEKKRGTDSWSTKKDARQKGMPKLAGEENGKAPVSRKLLAGSSGIDYCSHRNDAGPDHQKRSVVRSGGKEWEFSAAASSSEVGGTFHQFRKRVDVNVTISGDQLKKGGKSTLCAQNFDVKPR